jgi:hypothetical protein
MINFANATEVITKKDYSEERVVELIKSFNHKIDFNQEVDGKFEVIISCYTPDEALNEGEFEVARVNAMKNGWELTKTHRPISKYKPGATFFHLKKIKVIPAPQNFRIPINFRS